MNHRALLQALDFSIQRTRQNLALLESFPEMTQSQAWICVDDGGWVGGHWVGLLWLAYASTGDPALKSAARQWASRLAGRQADPTTHDLGFLFELSHVLGWQLTGDDSLLSPALTAAHTLARRFNQRGNFIQAWGRPDGPSEQRGRTIIDTMMNLNLLFWASHSSGDPIFAQIAASHARTALACQVRPDYSTAHVADFDPDSGTFLQQATHQGLSSTSCWSRGQAWAIYGFCACYQATGEINFLTAARNLADFALHRLPLDRVPYWDYDSPLIPADVRDSSAAAVMASGLQCLASIEPDRSQAKHWQDEAAGILASLWENFSSRDRSEPSILVHGTRSKPAGIIDQGLIYGDYYFVEALTRMLGFFPIIGFY